MKDRAPDIIWNPIGPKPVPLVGKAKKRPTQYINVYANRLIITNTCRSKMIIEEIIAQELGVEPSQVKTTIKLLHDGSTVPFIARYRKEATGGLSDTQLRQLEERLTYLTELEERRKTILKSIEEQGKLSKELRQAILAAENKTSLEDLYRPHMPKRHTKAQRARKAGLEPLAESILNNRNAKLDALAKQFIDTDKGINDNESALQGARDILIEQFAENAEILAKCRSHAWDRGLLTSSLVKSKEKSAQKYSDYFEFQQDIKKIPSHRALALYRGAKEGFLRLQFVYDTQNESAGEQLITQFYQINPQGNECDKWLFETAQQCWKSKLSLLIETEMKRRLKESSEIEAIRVFSTNLNDLLLAAPAGDQVTMGLDPGLRTGVKMAIVDPTGKVLAVDTIYPHAPKNQWQQSLDKLCHYVDQYSVTLIAIGNGTASRETDKLASELVALHRHVSKMVVSEAGASVYSASELASNELPELDVSLRGAVSIARRLQDPLAELVKIDPKSIGVGQYQHDVNQIRLNRALDAVVEDCVNAVGVDVNTASPQLLQRVAGLNANLAQNIVEYRQTNGQYTNRHHLLSVPRLGQKAFEQCAGFLRIQNGENPLDASSVHPEAYPVVEKILRDYNRDIKSVIGDTAFLHKLQIKDLVSENFGEPTVRDIISELEKPGRDPRPHFETAKFKEGIEKISDLEQDMRLQGIITNVTNFGAFVDIGVHQDGLLHISQLSDNYVSDPHKVVKTGDIVQVRVLEVDLGRSRISLSMKGIEKESSKKKTTKNKNQQRAADFGNSKMAEAFSKLKLK